MKTPHYTDIHRLQSEITRGLGFDILNQIELPEKQRRKLITIMSRISESSYRRGLYHASWAAQYEAPDIESSGRHLKTAFKQSLDQSPEILRNAKLSALERFSLEYGLSLDDVGLKIDSKWVESTAKKRRAQKRRK